ncbi:MAG: hypothetical protein LBN27_11860 [Prevotellaceae bacterium]|jgi:hypothetical protein|nr:hypothetical protein [Prevotellaceae bacterium]
MKIKHILIILGIGYCLELLFCLLNVFIVVDILTLQATGYIMYIMLIIIEIVGGILKAVGFISLIYKLFTNPKFKDFLNW